MGTSVGVPRHLQAILCCCQELLQQEAVRGAKGGSSLKNEEDVAKQRLRPFRQAHAACRQVDVGRAGIGRGNGGSLIGVGYQKNGNVEHIAEYYPTNSM